MTTDRRSIVRGEHSILLTVAATELQLRYEEATARRDQLYEQWENGIEDAIFRISVYPVQPLPNDIPHSTVMSAVQDPVDCRGVTFPGRSAQRFVAYGVLVGGSGHRDTQYFDESGLLSWSFVAGFGEPETTSAREWIHKSGAFVRWCGARFLEWSCQGDVRIEIEMNNIEGVGFQLPRGMSFPFDDTTAIEPSVTRRIELPLDDLIADPDEPLTRLCSQLCATFNVSFSPSDIRKFYLGQN